MSEEKKLTAKKLRRFDIKKLLANPELRQNLVVRSTIATQAREGIDVTQQQAETSYYVVTEGERAAFFGLSQFRTDGSEYDGRHTQFAKELADPNIRRDAAVRDFKISDEATLEYQSIDLFSLLYKNANALDPNHAYVRGGMNSTESFRFVRYFWEPASDSGKKWVPYCKGGSYSRFYSDLELVIDWTNDGSDLKALVRERYGSESRFIKSPEFYFKPGLTWTEKSSLGFSVRILEGGAIFNVAGPCAFPKEVDSTFFLLGILNADPLSFVAKALAGRNFGASYVARLPIPFAAKSVKNEIATFAQEAYKLKRNWATGNEICTCFDRPWALQVAIIGDAATLTNAVESALDHETSLDSVLQSIYANLNEAVFCLYGLNEKFKAKLEVAQGPRPLEIVWPQMEGRDRDQKRREHVDRLLCYLVKRVVEADPDHIVCLQRVAHEPPLIERLRVELATCFPGQDPNALETEVVNELKKKTKGYRRAESLAEWLNDAVFEIHNTLYLQRPLLWHLASNQVRTEPGFACLVHAHHFTAEGLAKLRSVYVRDRITTLRREAAQAGQDNKEAERLELLALAEEVEEYDAKLKLLQEGAHTGPEGGDRDYRILTPWKSPAERPKGWNPDLDDGIKVNLAPLARTNLLRRKLKLGEAKEED